MILWKLFFTFLKIGIFTFGGGYAMIALIQNEVVEKNGWMTIQEFTDIVATSQLTPGPVGINTATYTGYTAVVNAGYSSALGVAGAFLASFAVILLPFIMTLIVSRLLLKHKEHPLVAATLSILRLAIVGLIAAAALLLLTPENFGTPSTNMLQFIVSSLLFVAVFIASYKFKANPILIILICGIIGCVVYL
ncbi:MAG: chromate transporter [Bacteroidales bacterium]|nr:chromate transporter [Bacteroidales bacterium]